MNSRIIQSFLDQEIAHNFIPAVNKETLQRLNRGDKKAYQIVFEEYFNALCAFCYKYINDQSETEDIVQEVFISFWEHKKDFDHFNAIKAFLYTSARNKCLNHLKHRLVKQKHESLWDKEITT